jgi:hypothetical protein
VNIQSSYSFKVTSLHYGAGIAQWDSAGIWAGWPGVRVPTGVGNLFLHYHLQTGTGTQPIQWVQGLFPWKLSGRYVNLTTHHQLVPRWRMLGAVSPLPQYALNLWCSVKQHRDNFTFYLDARMCVCFIQWRTVLQNPCEWTDPPSR